MNIYASTKVSPYVYICTHKTTGKFYIGYREKNNLPSNIDLPTYKTSSKIVKPDFENYDWLIIAEFYNGDDAYDFEQHQIFANWSNPLLINKQYRLPTGKKQFKSGNKGKLLTEETKRKLSIAHTGKKRRPLTTEQKAAMRIAQLNRKPKSDAEKLSISNKISKSNTGRTLGPQSAAHIAKLVQSRTGRAITDEHKNKLSIAGTGRIVSDETKSKLSTSLIGKPKSEEHKLNLKKAWIKRKLLKKQ